MAVKSFNADTMAVNNKFFIAAHNTFTYLPIRKWYMKVLSFACKCQSIDVVTMYNLGVRVFDLRINMDNSTPRICHGLCEFNGDPISLMKLIDKPNVYVRVINERNKNLNAYKDYVFNKLIPSTSNIKYLVLDNKNTMKPIKDSRYPNGMQSYPTSKNYSCYWGHSADEFSFGSQKSTKIPNPESFSKKYNYLYDREVDLFLNTNNISNKTFWFDFIGKYNLFT